jgi:hypothetical protein
MNRGIVTERMLTTREAIEAAQNGEPIPDGIVDYREGEVLRHFVMQKGQSWGSDFGQDRRTWDCQFQ